MPGKPTAICAIFKDEAPFLLEWIAYHRAVGFDHFVLYDNDSTDRGADIIRASPLAPYVTLVHWPARPGQLSAYQHFIDIFAPDYEWAAFIDIDEFILPLDAAGIAPTLQRLAHASAILVHWRVFGPSGWDTPPPGLVIDAYDHRSPDDMPVNTHIKSIVKCADLRGVTENSHEFRVTGTACNTRGEAVPYIAQHSPPCHDHVVINHYFTRSRADWMRKIQRGSAMANLDRLKYQVELFEHLADACRIKDDAIKRFVPAVRAQLEPEPAPPAVDPAEMPAELTPESSAASSGPFAPPSSAAPQTPTQTVNWTPCGDDAEERADRAAFVFRDVARADAPWLAALRGPAAGATDPAFLCDSAGRLRDFTSAAAARTACDDALVGSNAKFSASDTIAAR